MKTIFPPNGHYELTHSARAEAYVWKDETAVQGTRFEFGRRKSKRNDKSDWDAIRISAQAGKLDEVPSDIYIRYYNQLNSISNAFLQPVAVERHCRVYWGPTGTGKSRRAWQEAEVSAYAKDPRTKFWCGYQQQTNVVIDEFRGGIDIAHLLRWIDRYPVRVEVKGGSRPLVAVNFWITSNLHPEQWYPDLDRDTFSALLRRLTIEEIN